VTRERYANEWIVDIENLFEFVADQDAVPDRCWRLVR
jgi:hypothetical protein